MRDVFALWILLVGIQAAMASAQLRYDTEYPEIGYSSSELTDRVARLQAELDAGNATLELDAEHGYLASVLRQLDVPVSSQMLVFSKTSFQKGRISSQTPRAIYFNDDVYVGWVRDGPELEISTVDPKLGAVFYTLRQSGDAPRRFERQTFLCLSCHDSYSLTGGGVPRHIMGSGVADPGGRLVSHEGWKLTTDQTPLRERWGGWYVTGTHGRQTHLGNIVATVKNGTWNVEPRGNVTRLEELIDPARYLGKHSDIVALMVAEHQVHVQNTITRVNYDARTKVHTPERAEPLVRALLLVDEAPLTDPIAGSSDFADELARRGPRDPQGRSLRELDLRTRLFRYPLSYLIYSDAFDALPDATKDYVYRRLGEVLDGSEADSAFSHLSSDDRKSIYEILVSTHEDFRKVVASR